MCSFQIPTYKIMTVLEAVERGLDLNLVDMLQFLFLLNFACKFRLQKRLQSCLTYTQPHTKTACLKLQQITRE